MKIGLVGYFGHGNFGDEIFAEVLTERLSCLGNVEILGWRPQPDESCDAIVIGGGDLLYAHKWSLDYFCEWLFEMPVYVCGIGASAWHGTPQLEVLSRLTQLWRHPSLRFANFRDYESARWCFRTFYPKIPLSFSVDLAWAWFRYQQEKHNDRSALVISNYESCQRVIDDCQLTGCDIIVASMNEFQSSEMRIAANLSDKSVTRDNLRDLEELIGSYRRVYSMKYHPLLSAAFAGSEFVSAVLTDKAYSFLASVEAYEEALRYPSQNCRGPLRLSSTSRQQFVSKANRTIDRLVEAIRIDQARAVT